MLVEGQRRARRGRARPCRGASSPRRPRSRPASPGRDEGVRVEREAPPAEGVPGRGPGPTESHDRDRDPPDAHGHESNATTDSPHGARPAACAKFTCLESLAARPMPPIASDALVLRTYKLGETSKVVVLLTRERGKVRAVAKGARGGAAPLPVGARAAQRGAGGAVRAPGRGAVPAGGVRAAALGLSARRRAAWTRPWPCRTSPSCSTRSPRRARPRTTCTGSPWRCVRAAEEGVIGDVLARYLEAWLLRLHGLYPPLDRCASCERALAARRPATITRAAHGFVCGDCGPASGPVLPARRAGFLRRIFRQAPGAVAGAAPATSARLERLPPGPDRAPPGARPALAPRAARRRAGDADERDAAGVIARCERYWAERGCLIHQPWDAEVGAGTMHPETFLRVLGPEAVARRLRAAVAASRRRPLRREPEPALQAPCSSR